MGKREKTLKEHLLEVSKKGWSGKVRKHGLEEARRKQSEYAMARWNRKKAAVEK